MECIQKRNEEKSVVIARFIRTLNKKIYNYMTAVSKNVYIDTVPWSYAIRDTNGEKTVGTFNEKEKTKRIQD